MTSASTAVTNGKVDAAVVTQPLTALDLQGGTVRRLVNGAGYLQTISEDETEPGLQTLTNLVLGYGTTISNTAITAQSRTRAAM